jgi:hypothetical protein
MTFEGKHTSKFWQERFGTPECARNYHYYAYEYLDDLSFLPSALEAFDEWHHAPKLLEEVSAKLKSLGWEGTGEFQMLWLPPFVGAGAHDNFGCYALHVKQDNDGISWIVSPVMLPFHRLFQPDDAVYPPPDPSDRVAKLRRKGMVRWLSDLIK